MMLQDGCTDDDESEETETVAFPSFKGLSSKKPRTSPLDAA